MTSYIRLVRYPYEEPDHLHLAMIASNGRVRGRLEFYVGAPMLAQWAEGKGFSEEARRKAGHQLNRVQHGHDPEDWKPMPTVGLNVREIRIHEEGEHRVLYLAKFAEAVYVLHAFRKKTRKTPKSDLDLASDRFRAVLEERRRQQR